MRTPQTQVQALGQVPGRYRDRPTLQEHVPGRCRGRNALQEVLERCRDRFKLRGQVPRIRFRLQEQDLGRHRHRFRIWDKFLGATEAGPRSRSRFQGAAEAGAGSRSRFWGARPPECSGSPDRKHI